MMCNEVQKTILLFVQCGHHLDFRGSGFALNEAASSHSCLSREAWSGHTRCGGSLLLEQTMTSSFDASLHALLFVPGKKKKKSFQVSIVD